MKKLLYLCLMVISVLTLTGCSQAKSTANDFMRCLVSGDLADLRTLTSSSFDVSSQFASIKLTDYKLKSVSDAYKVKHIVDTKNDGTIAGAVGFDLTKEQCKKDYPDYEVVTDTNNRYTIQSRECILSEYSITYAVKFSDALGNKKSNFLTLSVTQNIPDSDDYLVTNADWQ